MSISNASTSNVIGPALLKILGISSEKCRKATITIEAGCIVVVDVEYHGGVIDNEGLAELETVMDSYGIVKLD